MCTFKTIVNVEINNALEDEIMNNEFERFLKTSLNFSSKTLVGSLFGYNPVRINVLYVPTLKKFNKSDLHLN